MQEPKSIAEILNEFDECEICRTIVLSNTNINRHIFITWNFETDFEIWMEGEKGGYLLMETKVSEETITLYPSAEEFANIFFNEWLDSLDGGECCHECDNEECDK